jgi:flagellar hook-length control protein FliK
VTGISIDFLGLTPPVPPVAQPTATGGSFSVLVAGMLATHMRPAAPAPTVPAPAVPVPTLPLDRQDIAGQHAGPTIDADTQDDDAAPIIVDLALFDPIPVSLPQSVQPAQTVRTAALAAPVATVQVMAVTQPPVGAVTITGREPVQAQVVAPDPGAAAPEQAVPQLGNAIASPRAEAPVQLPLPAAPERAVQPEAAMRMPVPPVAQPAAPTVAPATPLAPIASAPPIRDLDRRVGADLRAMLKAFAPVAPPPVAAPAVAVAPGAEQPVARIDIQAPPPAAVAVDVPRAAPAVAPRAKAQIVSAPVIVAPIVADTNEPAPPAGASDAPVTAVAAPSASAAPITVREAAIVQRMPVVDTGRAEWIETLVDRIDDARGQGAARITQIRLMPDALGTVDIRIQQDADRVHVQFSTDTAQARALLTDAQPRLADLAEARGLKLGDTGVQHGTGGQRHAERDEPRADRPNRLTPDSDPDAPSDDSADRIA